MGMSVDGTCGRAGDGDVVLYVEHSQLLPHEEEQK